LDIVKNLNQRDARRPDTKTAGKRRDFAPRAGADRARGVFLAVKAAPQDKDSAYCLN